MDNTRSSLLKSLKVDVVSTPLGFQDGIKKKSNNGSNNGGTSAKQGMPDISDSINDR